MPRPPRADRPVQKNLHFPSSICAKVDLILWSELEEKVPHGAWSKYLIALVEKDLERRSNDFIERLV